METTSTVIYTAPEHGQPCQEWGNAYSRGSIPHSPLPFSRLAGTTEVGCDRCGLHLYTYKEVPYEVVR